METLSEHERKALVVWADRIARKYQTAVWCLPPIEMAIRQVRFRVRVFLTKEQYDARYGLPANPRWPGWYDESLWQSESAQRELGYPIEFGVRLGPRMGNEKHAERIDTVLELSEPIHTRKKHILHRMSVYAERRTYNHDA